MQLSIFKTLTVVEKVEMPHDEQLRTAKVIELCGKLVNDPSVIYLDNTPYMQASLPEFICALHNQMTFDLNEVYETFKTEIDGIRQSRLSILDYLTKGNVSVENGE